MMSHIEMEYAKTLKQVSQLERELAEAQAEIVRLKGAAYDKQFVRVPREPTEEMVLNGVRAFQHAYSETDNLADWKECYRAMIAMAPIHTREWIGLTDGEILEMFGVVGTSGSDINPRGLLKDTRRIEAKLKEKNGG